MHQRNSKQKGCSPKRLASIPSCRDILPVRFIKIMLVLGGLMGLAGTAAAAGKASHVILIVWDGMRPDLVSEENTPTLCQLARNGVTFLHHHPVYISSTEVNGTALATGVYPGQSTITANDEYRPDINSQHAVEMQALASVRKGDQLWNHHYLAFPTVCEILHENGMRTVVAGSKPVALLQDRAAREDGVLDVNVFAGETLPENWKDKLSRLLGNFPPAKTNKIQIDTWTAKALTGPLWEQGLPSYSLFWQAEPDFSQHHYSPGAPAAMEAIRHDDDNLARVLDALKQRNALDSTDVIVVSDHGFSTVAEDVDVAATLNAHGLHAVHQLPVEGLRAGDIVIVSEGGAVLCYAAGHDEKLIEQAVRCLQAEPYAGVFFTRKQMAGTFSLATGHLDSPYAADIIMAMRWKPGLNEFGVPGLICADRTSDPSNKGTHATLSPTEMHNTGFAAGPDFVRGMQDSLPTGNIDIAPTILWILGVEPKQKMSGRVLTEALTVRGPEIKSCESHRTEAEWQGDGFTWRQYLEISEVNGVEYFDQGNGRQETNHAAAQ
jgi:arylsulfatase A-like enzyme